MSLSIEHTEAEGTLLLGTSAGDGSGEVVKALGWRWGRSVGAWFVPRSRDVAPKRGLIERTGQALRGAGFEVTVSIDATVGDREGAEGRLAQRAQGRAERLAGRAQAEQGKADARHAAGRQIADGIPFGQPILLGHHSQRRAERDAERIRRHLDASVEHERNAERADAAARTAAAATGARHSSVTVANRILRLGAEIRRDEVELDRLEQAQCDPGSVYRASLQDRLAIARADLEHWQAVRAQQIATGAATNYGRDTVSAGDLVKIRGIWREV